MLPNYIGNLVYIGCLRGNHFLRVPLRPLKLTGWRLWKRYLQWLRVSARVGKNELGKAYSHKRRVRLRLFLSIKPHIYLLVIEAAQSGENTAVWCRLAKLVILVRGQQDGQSC